MIEQPATVRALNEATIFAQVAGYLATISVDKGDVVKRGDVVATIEVPELDAERQEVVAAQAQAEAEHVAAKVELERADSSLLAAQAGLKRAEADLALKKSLYDRAKDLRADNVVSVQDLEVAEGAWKESAAALSLGEARVKEADAVRHESEARILVAKAKVNSAAAKLGRIDSRIAYSKIRSPLNGIVTARWVDPGAMIQQATGTSTQAKPIVTIAEIDRVRIDTQIPEKDVAWIRIGQTVSLRVDVDAYRDRTFEGTVKRFAGALDSSRTMLVEAEYDNPDHALCPGMFGSVALETGRHKDTLTVPAEAIGNQDGAKTLFVVVSGRVHRRVVETGFDHGPTVEITKGLSADELVVVGGARLTEDMPVEVVERSQTTAAAKKQERE